MLISMILGMGMYKLAKAAVDDLTQQSEFEQSEEERRKEKEKQRDELHKELEAVEGMIRFWGMETNDLHERRITALKKLDELDNPKTEEIELPRRRMTLEERRQQQEISREVRRVYDWDQPAITPTDYEADAEGETSD